jgi:hypothetical protein
LVFTIFGCTDQAVRISEELSHHLRRMLEPCGLAVREEAEKTVLFDMGPCQELGTVCEKEAWYREWKLAVYEDVQTADGCGRLNLQFPAHFQEPSGVGLHFIGAETPRVAYGREEGIHLLDSFLV